MVLNWLLAIGFLVLSQLAVIAVLMGIGLGFRRAYGLRELSWDDCFLAIWVGLALVVAFLLGWNFLLRVSGWATLLVFLAGAGGLFAARAELAGLVRSDSWQPPRWLFVAGFLGAVWVASLAIGGLENYDSALYHLQVVRWAEQYPAVPGIANLDGPLAFNNSSLLFDALLSAGPWQSAANHLANGALVLALLLQVLVAGARLAAGDRSLRRWFEFLLLTPAVSLATNGGVSSFVTDVPTSLVVLVVSATILGLLTERDSGAGYRVVAIAWLLALAVTFKTNAAIFAATGATLVALVWWRRQKAARPERRRALRWAAAGIAILAVTWTGRGIVLSGYPLFPASLAGAPVPWRAPREHADAEFAYIVHSGRTSTRNLPVIEGKAGLEGWFPNWAHHALDNPYELGVPLGLALLGLLMWRPGRGQTRELPDPSGGVLVIPLGLTIIGWFLVAPEPRYALPYFWSLAALLAAQVAATRPGRSLLVAGGILGVSPVVVAPLAPASGDATAGQHPLQAILKANLNRPGSDFGHLQSPVGRPFLSAYVTQSGLRLQLARNRCWDAPLPCTPNPAPNLRLRKPGRLDRGFELDGSWQMLYWPLRWQPHFLAAWRKGRAARSGAAP